MWRKTVVLFQRQVKLKLVRSVCSEPGVISSPFPDAILPQELLHRYVFENFHKWPNCIAVECGVSGKKYTYSELLSKSKKFASSLKKSGLSRKDNVAIALPNTPEYPVSFLGVLEAGLTVTTVNPTYTSNEMVTQLNDCQARWVVCHPVTLPTILDVRKQMPDLRIICTHDFDGSSPGRDNLIYFEDFVGDDVNITDDASTAGPDETAVCFYSSGTTGLPKGTCLTHRSITANIAQFSTASTEKFVETHGDYQDSVAAVLPFFHCYGNVVIMLKALRAGAKLITLPKFDPKSFVNSLQHKNSLLFLVPPLIFFLGNSSDVTGKHLRYVREIMNGAAPCSSYDLEKIQNKAEGKILLSQGYGMTEASPVLTIYMPRGVDENTATVGNVFPNTFAKVVSLDTKQPLEANEIGELLFKGPQIMKGYLNNPKATAETVDPEGWLHTGDMGYYDDNSFFYITDRLKELIKVKGLQVAPAELEEVLRRHPEILEAGVVGAPSDKTGEVPVGFVQTKPGSRLSEEEVKQYLASKLSKHKHLASVRFLPSIPKTASGKILRKDLKTKL